MSRPRLRKPCANCPWRVDAPREYWARDHFVSIYRNCQDDGTNKMLCHKSRPPKIVLPCQGWIRVIGFNAISVRLLAMTGKVSVAEVEDKSPPKLFGSFEAMLRANRIPIPPRNQFVPVETISAKMAARRRR